jgi:hypothetical protein
MRARPAGRAFLGRGQHRHRAARTRLPPADRPSRASAPDVRSERPARRHRRGRLRHAKLRASQEGRHRHRALRRPSLRVRLRHRALLCRRHDRTHRQPDARAGHGLEHEPQAAARTAETPGRRTGQPHVGASSTLHAFNVDDLFGSQATASDQVLRLERTTGFEPATPTLARAWDSSSPCAHVH